MITGDWCPAIPVVNQQLKSDYHQLNPLVKEKQSGFQASGFNQWCLINEQENRIVSSHLMQRYYPASHFLRAAPYVPRPSGGHHDCSDLSFPMTISSHVYVREIMDLVHIYSDIKMQSSTTNFSWEKEQSFSVNTLFTAQTEKNAH